MDQRDQRRAEAWARRRLSWNGLKLHKARGKVTWDRLGGYQIVSLVHGRVWGERFELNLDQVVEMASECHGIEKPKNAHPTEETLRAIREAVTRSLTWTTPDGEEIKPTFLGGC